MKMVRAIRRAMTHSMPYLARSVCTNPGRYIRVTAVCDRSRVDLPPSVIGLLKSQCEIWELLKRLLGIICFATTDRLSAGRCLCGQRVKRFAPNHDLDRIESNDEVRLMMMTVS